MAVTDHRFCRYIFLESAKGQLENQDGMKNRHNVGFFAHLDKTVRF